MGTFMLFAVPFLLFGWGMFTLLRYTSESVGDESPLKRVVIYQYKAWDFLRWTNTPFLVFLCLFWIWVCWVVLSNLNTTTSPWHYVLAASSLALGAVLIYLLNKLFLLEETFWTIIRNTMLELDPATKSITVRRAGTSAVLTADTIARIESHVTAQGRFAYYYYRFVSQTGQVTFFYDYGKGLRFAIEDYFKGVPMTWVEHKFPFNTVQVA